MEIIRELKNDISVAEIKEIYKKGNKIGIKEVTDIELCDIDTILDDNEDLIEELGLEFDDVYSEDFKTTDSFSIDDGFLVGKKNTIIVYDSVKSAQCVSIKPFTGRFKDFIITCSLYEDNIIANKVYEIKE